MVSIPARSEIKQGFLAKIGEIPPEKSGVNPPIFPVATLQEEYKPQEEQETAKEEESDTHALNKYVYPEFAGYAGERYLDSIVQQILPYSQWRTWHYAVDFQAPGQACYVGPTRLAARVKPQERKIMLDFQRLEQANEYRPGVMHRYPTRLPIRQEDGTVKHCAVTVKDFSKLYELAHEYHCWMHGPAYIPAERDYAELLIMENPELAAWLCRFDNYRRILLCRKPGRKPTRQQQSNQLTAAQVVAIHQTNVLNVNQYFNASVKTDSAYRVIVTNQEEQSKKVSNDSTSLEGKEAIAAQTIRNEKTGINIEKTYMTEQESEEETDSHPNEETGEESPAPVEKAIASKSSISSQERAAAALSHIIPAHHWQKLHGGQRQAEQTPRRVKRAIPAHLENNIKVLSGEMGDSPEFWKSNVTRAFKLYITARQVYGSKEFTPRKFYGLVSEARSQARAKNNIEHTDESGQAVNRMPYWFTCFETLFQFNSLELAYARSQEPLYEDGHIKDFVIQYRQQRQATKG